MSTTTTDTITERVRRGALLLDMEVPGWAGRIDDSRLDLAGCPTCILGQLFGSYLDGVISLELNTDAGRWTDDFGFFVLCLRRTDEQREAEYQSLRAAWLAEIRARLAPEPDEAIGARNCPEHAALMP
jgi:hypothetical protein